MSVRRWVLLVFTVVANLAAGCGGGDDGPAAPAGTEARAEGAQMSAGRLQVVTTVAPITSIAASVAGDLVDIRGVVPEGTNSHTFEPEPSVAEVLSEADVIFINGLVLEEPIKGLAETHLKDGAKIVELGNEALPESDYMYDFSFPQEGGKPNPHLWTDPTYARRYADIIRRELSAKDPVHAQDFQRHYDDFSARIDEFDAAMREAFATVPREKRKLLTYHDAYAYFAKTYDWTVIGAIQVESFEDPTPKELAGLIEQVRAEKVPAIFGSEVFPSPVLEQIGKEAGVKYVDVLRDDDLPGEPGEAEHSWMGLMRFDYVTMVEALGGDATALRDFPVGNVAEDTAEYPQ